MNYTIQLRGPRIYAFALTEQGETVIPLPKRTDLIPGDIINENYAFVERVPQITLGIVKSIQNFKANLYCPFFGPACPFTPTVNIIPEISIGDFFILKLDAKGNTIPLKSFPLTHHLPTVLKEVYECNRITNNSSEYVVPNNNFYTIKEIVDHTDLNTFTIDPTTSKDFDDAISISKETSEVFIHIVDIAHADLFDWENEALKQRCFTLYLGSDFTDHLLSEEKANDILSLVPGKNRLTITVRVKLNSEGLVENYDIYQAIINVKNRLDYNTAQAAMELGQPVMEWLLNLVHTRRNRDINYSITLPSLSFDTAGNPIRTNTQDDAHKLVEGAMVLCNMVVSKHLHNSGIYIPNRFHDKLKGFRCLEQDQKTHNSEVDSFILVKRFATAKYEVNESGHFGLGLEEYCHFTSPMRRYADVIVHRLLAGWKVSNEMLEKEVEWINYRARLVKGCQEVYRRWKTLEFLKKNPSFSSDTWITDVKPNGCCWFMPSLNLNGFCFIGYLRPQERYEFVEGKLLSSGKVFSLGMRVKGTVKQIDYMNTDIYLE